MSGFRSSGMLDEVSPIGITETLVFVSDLPTALDAQHE